MFSSGVTLSEVGLAAFCKPQVVCSIRVDNYISSPPRTGAISGITALLFAVGDTAPAARCRARSGCRLLRSHQIIKEAQPLDAHYSSFSPTAQATETGAIDLISRWAFEKPAALSVPTIL